MSGANIPPALTTTSVSTNPRFFFIQAEDGIRGGTVTGVQTCALPISRPAASPASRSATAVADYGGAPPWDSNHKALISAAARGVAGFATPAHGNHRVVTATTVWGRRVLCAVPHRRGTGGAQPVIGGCRGRPPTVTA